MSIRIKKIEEHLKCKLFERKGNNLVLTASGKVFLNESKHLISEYYHACNKSLNASYGYADTLTIGFSNVVDCLALSNLWSYFHKCYPDIQVLFTKLSNLDLKEALFSKEVDLIVDFTVNVSSYYALHIKPLSTYDLCFAFSKQHSFSTKAALSLKDVGEYNHVLFNPPHSPNIARAVENSWKSTNFSPVFFTQVQSSDEFTVMMASGMAIGIVPSYYRNIFSDVMSFADIKEKFDTLTLAVACCTDNQSPALKLFFETIEKADLPALLPNHRA
ncbi:LysR family transcriptional regulator [Spirochaetia bacterium]|nr:LysR family transcriptional regulator [Spirochaetia bacterium]